MYYYYKINSVTSTSLAILLDLQVLSLAPNSEIILIVNDIYYTTLQSDYQIDRVVNEISHATSSSTAPLQLLARVFPSLLYQVKKLVKKVSRKKIL